jgi:oligoribonuclease NrnB/cAMP/cGMP phosphodiesterase (DHH superfamily)
MTKTIHIWHHNDNDGRCAAYIARIAMEQKYDKTHDEVHVYYNEMDYSKEPDFSGVAPQDTCIIVDFSFKKEAMKELHNTGSHIIWIDHHKTAIEALADYVGICGIRRTTDSATLLAWEYFFPNIETPYAVRLVDDHDAWKHKLPESMDFLMGSQLFNRSPSVAKKENFWDAAIMDEGAWQKASNQGKLINLHQKKQNESRLKAIGWVGTIEGCEHFVLCMNGVRGSQSFESANTPFSVLCAYEHKGDVFTVSLYSDRGVDVSELAKKQGGGGHAGAAGFICRQLPIRFVEHYSADK